MGSYFVLAFFVAFGLAVLQGVFRMKTNPYSEVPYTELPPRLRSELDRLLPDFAQRTARLRKRGDEARIEGERGGERITVEADFDGGGELIELEVEVHRSTRKTGRGTPEDLSDAARRELERVLGDDLAGFELRAVYTGSDSRGEPVFEVKGHTQDWKWEVELSASGQLLELEREKKLRRR